MDLEKLLSENKITEEELKKVIKGISEKAPKSPTFKDYFKRRTKIGVFSDCHIGHTEFDEPFFNHMVEIFKKEKVKRVYQVGDILEGMSGRDGQIYELSEIGFENQINKAVKMFKRIPMQIHGIDGNHDEWYKIKNNGGVIVGKELESRLSNYHNLGCMEASVEIAPEIKMNLYHGRDGTAYAVSYKMQKLMESFSGGEKPNILLSGHYHKALYMFNRNIHGLEAGTICGQTSWMRGKKIPAHKGFWVIDIEMGKGGIGKFAPEFYAGYK
jgi:predicted phosphodiesterase